MDYYYKLIIRILIPLIISYALIESFISNITLDLVYFISLLLNQSVFIVDNFLFFNDKIVGFVEACGAPSAYYLLLLLVCYTKDIKFIRGLKVFFYGSFCILVINLFRILLLLFVLDMYGRDYFDTLHMWFWGVISSTVVALIWIFFVKRYHIIGIPVVSDVKYLLKRIKLFK